MVNNVLFPTDGSSAALNAAEVVADFYGETGNAKVTVVIVIEPLSPEDSDYDDDVVARHNEKMRERAQKALDLTAKIFTRKNMAYETKILEGDPVSAALAEEAQSGDYSVVAMGSRGLGMQKNNLHYLGSVTEHVIRRVSVPVLVIPAHKDK